MQTGPMASNAAEGMKTVKVARDKAPAGPGNDTVQKHCRAAEKAQAERHDGDCNPEMDARVRA